MSRIQFGAQLFPYHRPEFNTTLQFEEDLQLAEHLDRLGFDQIWFGEHHSTGWETFAMPELMALAAADRTKHIKVGLGVTSVPYHHPLLLADRIVALDHLTRGRVLWGIGTGSLAQDAHMIGLEARDARRMSEEGAEAISRLLEYGEPVNMKTDWFELRDAALQLRPYSDELDIRVAAMKSPSGPRLAGKFGFGLFQFAAMGDGVLENAWTTWSETAEEHGQTADRSRWSALHHVYLADTEEQAREDLKWGIHGVLENLNSTTPLFPGGMPEDYDELIDALNGFMVIGTPEMAISRIEEILERSGGLGSFIIGNLEGAEPSRVQRSFELFARHVIPHFNGDAAQRRRAAKHTQDYGQNAKELAAAQAQAEADYQASRVSRS